MMQEKKEKIVDKNYEFHGLSYAVDEENDRILIQIDGKPTYCPRARPRAIRVGKKWVGKVYDYEPYAEWKNEVAKTLKEQGFYDEPLLREICDCAGGFHFGYVAYYPWDVKRKNPPVEPFKVSAPDVDNIAKAYMDAILTKKYMPKRFEDERRAITDARVSSMTGVKLECETKEEEGHVLIEIAPTIKYFGRGGRRL